jgi:hypothetical protein
MHDNFDATAWDHSKEDMRHISNIRQEEFDNLFGMYMDRRTAMDDERRKRPTGGTGASDDKQMATMAVLRRFHEYGMHGVCVRISIYPRSPHILEGTLLPVGGGARLSASSQESGFLSGSIRFSGFLSLKELYSFLGLPLRNRTLILCYSSLPIPYPRKLIRQKLE